MLSEISKIDNNELLEQRWTVKKMGYPKRMEQTLQVFSLTLENSSENKSFRLASYMVGVFVFHICGCLRMTQIITCSQIFYCLDKVLRFIDTKGV